MKEKVNLLIVSPSAIARKILSEIFEEDLIFEVESAKDLDEALQKLKKQEFDIVLLDIDWKESKTLNALKEINRLCKSAIVITPEDVPEEAFNILHSDKFTYITRPGRFSASLRDIKDIIYHSVKHTCQLPVESLVQETRFILIGSSTGGPGLIEKIARSLPEDYPHPICVAQHMPSTFTGRFAERLNSVSKIKVVEAKNGELLEAGKMIIAKGGYHLHFMKKGNRIACKLVPNTNGRFFVPSVDEMFFSAVEVMDPKKVVAVILTGIGDDGADGMVALRKLGAYTIAESEETAVVYGMPKEAYLRGGAQKVLPFPEIVEEILRLGA